MYKQLSQEYMDLDTLENGLHYLPKLRPFNSHNSSSICTMVPTPGVSNGGNPNYMVTSSGDAASGRNGIAHSTANNGSISPSGSGFFNSNSGFASADVFSSKGYHGGNNMASSAGIQTTNQMIPTPGFNGNTCQPYMNLETSSAGGCFANVESKVVSQQQHQHQHRKQHTAGQNSGIMHNRGIQMDNGNRSTKHQKAYVFSNGNLNGNVRMNGHSMQNMTEPGTLEGCFSGTPYGNSSKPLSQHFDHQQMLPLAGDGYNIGSADPSWIGNFYGNGSTSGSVMSSNLNPVSLQSISNITSPLISNQPNLLSGKQAAQMNPQSTDQSDKMDIRIPVSTRDTVLQSPQEQHTKAHQQLQFVQNQYTQKQLSQQQHLSIKKESFESQLTNNPGSQVKVEKLGYHSKFHSQGHAQFQNELNCVPSFAKSESLMQSQWHPQPQSQDQSLKPGALVPEPHIHEESRHRITGHVEAQRNNLLVEGSMVPQTAASVSTVEHLRPSGTVCRTINANHERLLTLQRKWLFYLHHARRCQLPEGKCYEQNCVFVQNLCRHIEKCSSGHCPRPRCLISKKLINHFKQCRDPHCPVCAPVKSRYLKEKVKAHTRQGPESGIETPMSTAFKPHDSAEKLNKASVKTSPIAESCEYLHPMKRVKTEQSSQYCLPEGESSLLFAPISKDPYNTCNVLPRDNQLGGICTAVKPESMEVEVDGLVKPIKDNYHSRATKEDSVDDTFHGKPNVPEELPCFTKQENIKPEKMIEPELQRNVTLSAEQTGSGKSGKPNIKGVSMTELFTPEQVREHISGLRQWVGQSKAKAEKNQAMKHSMSENCCQLCAVERLTFEPPPTYCSPCGGRIKRNAMYYSIGTGETKNFFCIPCYNDARGDTVRVDGRAIPKIKLEKRKNDEETEEWWVQCDKCEAWQHQICALFNGRRNEGGQAEYTCPNCYIVEVEKGERSPLPQSAVLGAKDLPRTILSDQIEQRLFRKLKQERQERANRIGKSYDEVPGAEALVVRVVSSVDKKLEVKQRFLEIFREENYPKEYPYKSKVVLLFQKIEGVEVCLFGMYVQEFGSECELPNQRRVYLSYLDSVKYFRPDIKAVTGEALRTFVYHEILIGYLEYCKKRGFTSCYIWACPPLKGEDYILYCHPEIQKTPKSDKLREWYLSMLRKASEENIVVDLTNLHDHFFMSTGECKTKVTAARLPYFDGDYWPGSAEDLIYQMQQEEDGTRFSRKGLTKKTISKRALKASGHTDLSGSTPKDLILMHKLGETISPMKEDFIMVHLQHACTHCCTLMVSGNRWVCKQCKKFQLCDKCYDVERKLEDRDRHPIHHREAHALFRFEITDVPEDTKDKDETLESEFFDTRQAFLSLCQGNHYQYDTLRRAKHSSMMVLYHLHNPTAPAFVTTCNACRLDIETGQGWRCEICPDFDVCNNCYQKDGSINHPHKLTNHPSLADRDAQNTEARQQRVLQLRKMLDLLVHASQCRSMACKYPSCRKVKGLFRHGMQCRQRAAGGCGLCKKMWYLLQIHARSCKESECNVPRCSDLREHMKRLQQQAESRRRAAVMEMMRQRAAEVAAGNS